ncbi:aminotransferase class V-fold PLP-dependent enzyme, partial [Escherichia coli]
RVLGRTLTTIDYREDRRVDPADVERALAADPTITHVALVHCETGAGVLNPLHDIAQVVAKHGRALIVDAMSSFGA